MERKFRPQNGSANETGFRIYNRKLGIEITTPNFNKNFVRKYPNPPVSYVRAVLLRTLGIMALIAFPILIFLTSPAKWFVLIPCLTVAGLWSFIILDIHYRSYRRNFLSQHSFVKNMGESHTCEHKTIWLLWSGLELTLENLKRMTPYSNFCSGNNFPLFQPSLEKLEEALQVALKYEKEIDKIKNQSVCRA